MNTDKQRVHACRLMRTRESAGMSCVHPSSDSARAASFCGGALGTLTVMSALRARAVPVELPGSPASTQALALNELQPESAPPCTTSPYDITMHVPFLPIPDSGRSGTEGGFCRVRMSPFPASRPVRGNISRVWMLAYIIHHMTLRHRLQVCDRRFSLSSVLLTAIFVSSRSATCAATARMID